MTHDRDLDKKVRTWLEETPPGPPDRDAVYARMLDRLPETHQRRHWWPFRWNPFAAGATRSADADGPHPAGRSRTMFNATGIVAAAAILALGGSLVLIAGPLGPSEAPVPPGAEIATVSMEPAHFTGSVTSSESGAGETEELPDRTIERGWPSAWFNNMSDPRVEGRGSSTNYLEVIEVDGGQFLSHASLGELVNGDGTFIVSCTGAGAIGFPAVEGEPNGNIVCWYVGKGGYDGLVAYVVLTSVSPMSGYWDAEGWIWPGEPPTVE